MMNPSQPEPSTTTTMTSAYASNDSSIGYVPTTEGERRVLMVDCPTCGRSFKRSALEVHQKACKTVFANKKKPEENRLDLSQEAPMSPQQSQSDESWRQSSQQLRMAMRAAKKQAAQQAEPDVRYL